MAQASKRERHTGAFNNSAEVDRLTEPAGFIAERIIPIQPDIIAPYRLLVSKLNAQRIVKIARLSVCSRSILGDSAFNRVGMRGAPR
jgi:hypothetical protein